MDTNTFQLLERIRDRFGPGIFGKIVQKQLALAFYEAGFKHIVERGVQGVDIDAATVETKYALEVKTTEARMVSLSEENISALKDRAKDGYTPLVAVLRMRMFEDWILGAVPLGRLEAGSLPLSHLRAYRLSKLEASICPIFVRVVNRHSKGALAEGEHYLMKILDNIRQDPT
ncbi:MAG: hypothetical protein HY673_01245 [Chloroflexi bacterium]|nr:hypothetical protein [Chloroflexota bacterium]